MCDAQKDVGSGAAAQSALDTVSSSIVEIEYMVMIGALHIAWRGSLLMAPFLKGCSFVIAATIGDA